MSKAIDDKEIPIREDIKEVGNILKDQFNWDVNDTKKIWCFGPDESGPNCIVDQTISVQFMNEIQDSCKTAFQWVTKEGAMT